MAVGWRDSAGKGMVVAMFGKSELIMTFEEVVMLSCILMNTVAVHI